MPQTSISAAIYCVDAPTIVVTQGDWQGVKLWTLLNETGISPEATKIAFYATDGYTTDLTVDTVQNNNIILAYAKDGAPLSETLRLVVPGQYGYKWISQVTKIEAVSYDFKGTWESQGYPDDATMASSNLDNFGTPSPSTRHLHKLRLQHLPQPHRKKRQQQRLPRPQLEIQLLN